MISYIIITRKTRRRRGLRLSLVSHHQSTAFSLGQSSRVLWSTSSFLPGFVTWTRMTLFLLEYVHVLATLPCCIHITCSMRLHSRLGWGCPPIIRVETGRSRCLTLPESSSYLKMLSGVRSGLDSRELLYAFYSVQVHCSGLRFAPVLEAERHGEHFKCTASFFKVVLVHSIRKDYVL